MAGGEMVKSCVMTQNAWSAIHRHYYPAVSVLSPPFANQSDLVAFQAIQATHRIATYQLLRFAAEGSDLLLFVIFSPACLGM